MLLLPISDISNQEITFTIDSNFFEFAIKVLSSDDKEMSYTLKVNNDTIMSEYLLSQGLLIPYDHKSEFGNFYVESENKPFYTDFNNTCKIYYLAPTEIDDFLA